MYAMGDIPLFGGSHGVGLTTELVVVPCGGTDSEDGGSRGSGGGCPLGRLGTGGGRGSALDRLRRQLGMIQRAGWRSKVVGGMDECPGVGRGRTVDWRVAVLRAAAAMRADRRLDLANMVCD